MDNKITDDNTEEKKESKQEEKNQDLEDIKYIFGKVKQGAQVLGEKLGEAMTTVVDTAKKTAKVVVEKVSSVISDSGKTTDGKSVSSEADAKTAADRAAFAAIATAASRDGNEVAAILDDYNKTVTVLKADGLEQYQTFRFENSAVIVSGGATPTEIAPDKEDADAKVECLCAPFVYSFSDSLSGKDQFAVRARLTELRARIDGYTPSFFKRKKYAELKNAFAAFEQAVLSGSDSKAAYEAFSAPLAVLLPECTETADAIIKTLA